MSTSAKRRRERQSVNPNERHSSGMPSRDYRYRDVRFRESGGSKAMSVNGSVTPVDFFIQPPSGELWIVDYVTLLLIDPGTMSAAVFGSLVGALANGLELIEKVNSVESIYTNVQDNADLAQCFFGGTLSGVSPSGGADLGFLDTVDKVTGRMCFDGKVTLDGDDNDQLILRVNDDLLLIQSMQASAHIKVRR